MEILLIIPTRLHSNAAMVTWEVLVSMTAETTSNGHFTRETRFKSASFKPEFDRIFGPRRR
jgi:hypothetical protein